MAAGTLPKPGTEYGPCPEPCEHTDCSETRKMASAECAHCDEPIGYDTRFYRVRELEEAGNQYASRVYAHARCEEAAADCRCLGDGEINTPYGEADCPDCKPEAYA